MVKRVGIGDHIIHRGASGTIMSFGVNWEGCTETTMGSLDECEIVCKLGHNLSKLELENDICGSCENIESDQ